MGLVTEEKEAEMSKIGHRKTSTPPVMNSCRPKMQIKCMPQIYAVMLQGPLLLPGR